MTKMQIIAKAFLTFLGLSALKNFCIDLTKLPTLTLAQTQNTSILWVVLFLPLVIIFIIAVVYVLILNNDWLVYKIAGPGEKLSSESETLWLAGSLRMVAILYGLLLLSSSIMSIPNLFASLFFTSGTCPKPPALTISQWSSTIYYLLQTILAVYLLYGWPQFIRYQLCLRKSELSLDKKLNTGETKNE